MTQPLSELNFVPRNTLLRNGKVVFTKKYFQSRQTFKELEAQKASETLEQAASNMKWEGG